MSSLVITVKSEESQTVLRQLYKQPLNNVREQALVLAQLFKDYASLNKRAVIDVQTGSANPVAASGTLTLASAVATDAVTIGAVTLTASSTPANENQWEIDGADDAADATSLAAAINAHSVLSLVVTAEANSAVVTITAKQKGVVGNQIPLSSADATITASAAFLAGGTGGVAEAASSYALGIA
jgi:phage tail sheath gpL-like